MIKNNSYEYEDDLDILYVNNNPTKEKVEGSMIFGNVVADIGFDGKVLGVEIDSASNFLKISPAILNNLNVAEVRVMHLGSMVSFGIVIKTPLKEHVFQFAVPEDHKKVPVISY